MGGSALVPKELRLGLNSNPTSIYPAALPRCLVLQLVASFECRAASCRLQNSVGCRATQPCLAVREHSGVFRCRDAEISAYRPLSFPQVLQTLRGGRGGGGGGMCR
ncbi:hypothetical protein BO70DRAFT_175828 [Aspergillus heteromorphus CBS 117.55]|uniref:Uncharacterized protein n=1 Tax=Aspergillus heteromorphus CBS 117.55 TaxID=1448321 RepID=A0A317UYI1_9EURO|nr:uncharacterized protein BO70DRAFT_175828 [Aspergillus heteromorphus CBS 117.55]PWY65998.1 hypothetical protein BO70DRAFT_175828 [Aspergillus heteromorphus CBS 117.55]